MFTLPIQCGHISDSLVHKTLDPIYACI